MTEMTVSSHSTGITDKIKPGSVGLLYPNLECKVSCHGCGWCSAVHGRI